jgi:thiaminase/transcriptional activator TenA
MSDLLRVVERSQDHAMDIEDYLAREQLGEPTDDPTAPHPVGFAERWGIAAQALEAEPAAPATAAYTNFLLRTGALGDYAELVAALLPCVWGYAEIGARLAQAGMPDHAGYTAWIAVYADPEFQALAEWARELTEAAGGDAGPGARERMHAAFRASSEHELAFWESAWRYEDESGAPAD